MYRNITEFGTSKLFSLRRSLIFARVRAGEVGWCFVSAKIGTANMQNLFFHFSQFKTVRKKNLKSFLLFCLFRLFLESVRVEPWEQTTQRSVEGVLKHHHHPRSPDRLQFTPL